MSDFLANLAARSSRSAEALQPRLPSLFEPLRPSVSLGAPSLMEWEENSDAPEEIIRTNDSQRVPHPSPVTASRTGDNLELEPSMPQAPDTPIRVQRSVFRPAEPRPDPVRPQTHPTIPASVPRPPAPQIPLSESPVAASPAQPERTATLAARKILPAVPAHSGVAAGPNIESPHIPVDRDSPFTRSGNARSRNTIEPRVTSRPEDSRRRDLSGLSQARSPASEPVIQVTIGRIEVRAAAQQAPSPKERSASPVMRLDEYLRQKRAGA